MTQIYLARHGETEWNAAGRIQGHTNSPLSALGQRQAQALASRMSGIALTAVYASDLSRARDTAAPVAASHRLEVHLVSDLREKSYGEWEGLSAEEIEARDPDAWHRYRAQGDLNFAIPGGETWPEVQERITGALATILLSHSDPDETVLIVGHGGSLRCALLFALEAPLRLLRRFHLDNASLSLLEFRAPGDGRILLVNDTSHLQRPGI